MRIKRMISFLTVSAIIVALLAGCAKDKDSAVTARVGALIGPTGMGMAWLIENGGDSYEFSLLDSPDKVSPMLINGELDIAALPVNVASVLYNKTNKGVSVLNVNTLGVIYILTNGEEIATVADLKGKTIYASGQGATPEYVLKYILAQNGIDPDKDVVIEFKSEHAELATLLAAGEIGIAVLPEPFVTTVTTQNQDIKIALDLTSEWESATGGAVQTTGCIVVRNEFLKSNPGAVKAFMDDYKRSAEFVNANIEEAAALMEKLEIIPKAAVAMKALPRCNIVFLEGDEMKSAVQKYLEVLYAANPQAVGGALPDEAFYYKR